MRKIRVMLKGKNIVVCVCGGIAAFKAISVVSILVKMGARVDVIMTDHAREFVTPLSFRSIAKTPVITDMFEEPDVTEIKHISLAQRADAFVICPATANIIGKIANGIADDMVSTTVMATRAPTIIVPAMNTNMYENVIVQGNIAKLKDLGYIFMEPDSGLLACGISGKGRMPEPEKIAQRVALETAMEKDLNGLNVLVTAGPTREAIDPIRYISNGSSGKMGYAIAANAAMRGANVRLVSGPVSLDTPMGVENIPVVSARDMHRAVMENREYADIIVMAAAVGDFRPETRAENKIKKNTAVDELRLTKNPDILAELGKERRPGQVLVGFCMETQNLIACATEKLYRKNADIIVANDLNTMGAGFGVDTNVVTVLFRDGREPISLSDTKQRIAHEILSVAAGIKKK